MGIVVMMVEDVHGHESSNAFDESLSTVGEVADERKSVMHDGCGGGRTDESLRPSHGHVHMSFMKIGEA